MQRHTRRSFATTGTTALFAATLLATPAMAAETTSCRGLAVTMDGTGQTTVSGTEEADVIVASAGSTVSALAGDDTICVLPGDATTTTTVDAGTGADTVDASALPVEAKASTDLGAGDDTYLGGPAADRVVAGDGADTVTTYGGADDVVSGIAGEPNADELDLGDGDDVLAWHGMQVDGGSVSFGEGADTLTDTDGGVVAVDASARKLSRAGESVLVWDGAVATYVVESSATQVTFKGTDAAESFEVRDPATGALAPTVDADMAGGDDTITIRANVLDGSTWTGGEGTDLLRVAYDYDTLYLDLSSGQFETGAPDVTADQRVVGIEDVDAVTATATIKGTGDANQIQARGCAVTIIGRAGDDDLSFGTDIEDRPWVSCEAKTLEARGRKGDDTIVGSPGADRLFGNAGADFIKAKGGADLVSGAADDDRMRGNAGDDKLRGGSGADEIAGNGGDDRLYGDKDDDRLLGHGGNDLLVGGKGTDRGYGGKGTDRSTSVERRYNIER